MLIDSGAGGSFIYRSLANQIEITTIPLQRPLEVSGLNCQALTRVTHLTAPVCLQLSGNHPAEIALKLINSPQVPVVFLGWSNTTFTLIGV